MMNQKYPYISMNTRKVALIIIVILGLLGLFPHFVPSLYMYYATFSLIGALWTLSLNFFMGYCGQINFGVGAFGFISGYSFALLVTKLGVPTLVAALLSIIIVCLVTYAVSIILVRLREVELGLGTLAFSLALHAAVSTSLKGITGGEDGISLPPLTIFGRTMGDLFYFYVCLVLVVLCCFVSYLVLDSRIGRAMKAIGQDEIAARSVGIDIPKYWRLGLILNALFGGLAAVLYVQWVKWISPEHFGLHLNILVLLALVVGGMGKPLGATIGGMFIFLLPQFLVALQEWSTLVYGLILVLVLKFLPSGIAGAGHFLIFRFTKFKQGHEVRQNGIT